MASAADPLPDAGLAPAVAVAGLATPIPVVVSKLTPTAAPPATAAPPVPGLTPLPGAPAAGAVGSGKGVAEGAARKNVTTCTITSFDEDDGAPTGFWCDLGLAFEVAEPLDDVGTEAWYIDLIFASGCVLTAAFAAGMTLGFTSLDPFQMEVLSNVKLEEVDPGATKGKKTLRAQLESDQGYAARILPVISGRYFGSGRRRLCKCRWLPDSVNPSNEHYLLVTLLLLNAAANEALPLYLDHLVPSWLAVLLSVTVVLIFGEILPSAIFTGPQQLRLAAAMVPLVQLVRTLVVPIVWPLSLLLDKCLGHEEDPHTRHELRAMIRTLRDNLLEKEEADMLQGVLDMKQKTAKDIGLPIGDVKALPLDTLIDWEFMQKVLEWGHSRIFIYRPREGEADEDDRTDICGIFLVKKLLGVHLERGARLSTLHDAVRRPVVLGVDDTLLSAMAKFQSGTSHLGIISADPVEAARALQEGRPIPKHAAPRQFCSLEDVMEAMLRSEIFDEDDQELGRHLLPRRGMSSNLLLTRWGTRRSVIGNRSTKNAAADALSQFPRRVSTRDGARRHRGQSSDSDQDAYSECTESDEEHEDDEGDGRGLC